jgi:hypothetical protein
MGAVTFDPVTEDFWRRRPQVYRRLRDEEQVLYDEHRSVYVLSRFEDVFLAANNTALFSSRASEANVLLPMLNFLDAPRHTQLRRLVSRGFTPARVAAMRPQVVAVVDALLSRFVARSGGDLIEDFSGPLASTIVGGLIGVPRELLGDFRRLTDTFLEFGQAGPTEDLQKVSAQIYELFAEIIAVRREERQDDLISVLLEVQDGGGISDEEILGFCFLLVGGGNDTTTNLIANGWVLLLDHAEQLALLRDDRALLPSAIDEMLRLEPPAESHVRRTLAPITLHGVTIDEGSRVQLLWGAANRDPREFSDPDRFDVLRRPNRHLSFGHGVHYCLGSALARLEAEVAFDALLDRCVPSELVERPRRVLSPWACAYEHVELRLPTHSPQPPKGDQPERS